MSESQSHQDKALFSEANDSCVPADRARHELSATPEQPTQRVGAEQYLEALRQGIMLSS